MKKLIKILGIVLGIVIVLAVAGIIYLNNAFPKAGPVPNVKVESTPERMARGKYLANHVAGCVDCHSTRDWSRYSGPITMGTDGKGGQRFGEEMGFPGTLYAKNITPAGIGSWSDGELIHSIVSGISKNGNVLFPLMPYPNFSQMSQEDLYSIVAYIRSLQPIENQVAESHVKFPVSMFIKQVPKPYTPASAPDTSNTIAYGKYLVNMASCAECHTQREKGELVAGMEFAGGTEFNLPWGVVRPVNITPDRETGIGNWTRETFIAKFKYFATPAAANVAVGPKEFNTLMPWIPYSGMTEQDLGAMYDYLRTVKPVRNQVVKFTPAK